MKLIVKIPLFILSLLILAGCEADLTVVSKEVAWTGVDIKVVQTRFENALIVMDQKTGIPAKITGFNYRPKLLPEIGIPITDDKVDSLFKAFLDENKEVLGVTCANLKLVSKTMRKGKWYVKYQQLHQKIPILDATIGMVGTEEGAIIDYAASYLPDIRIGTREKISMKKAIDIAKETYEKTSL